MNGVQDSLFNFLLPLATKGPMRQTRFPGFTLPKALWPAVGRVEGLCRTESLRSKSKDRHPDVTPWRAVTQQTTNKTIILFSFRKSFKAKSTVIKTICLPGVHFSLQN